MFVCPGLKLPVWGSHCSSIPTELDGIFFILLNLPALDILKASRYDCAYFSTELRISEPLTFQNCRDAFFSKKKKKINEWIVCSRTSTVLYMHIALSAGRRNAKESIWKKTTPKLYCAREKKIRLDMHLSNGIHRYNLCTCTTPLYIYIRDEAAWSDLLQIHTTLSPRR